MAGLGRAIGLFGTGVSDLFGAQASKITAQGDWAAAQSYTAAAGIARKNESLTNLSTEIQEAQTNRKVLQTIGGQTAAEGAANVGQGGSAGDLLRESMQQGALAKTLVQTQGAIKANAFEEQALAYTSMSTAAKAASNAADEAAKGQTFGAAFSFAGGALGLLGL
jgi:hypothetical protein